MTFFSTSQGHASIQDTDSLWDSATQCFDKLVKSYGLAFDNRTSHQDILRSILRATFDKDICGFLDNDAQTISRLDDALDEVTKARVMAQAVAGMSVVLERLQHDDIPITAQRFNVEVQRFAQSEHRRRLVDMIEHSRTFGRCYATVQIRDVIVKAVEDRCDTLADVLGEDGQTAIGWASELPSRNMGLPWGFTILALN